MRRIFTYPYALWLWICAVVGVFIARFQRKAAALDMAVERLVAEEDEVKEVEQLFLETLRKYSAQLASEGRGHSKFVQAMIERLESNQP